MGRQGQEHMDTGVAETSRAQLPQGRPKSSPRAGTVLSVVTCRTEWVAVRDSGGEHTDTQVCTQAHAH